VQKSGFREIGVMRLTRMGPRRRVVLAASGGVAAALAQSLGA
jgi:hypothetical protein